MSKKADDTAPKCGAKKRNGDTCRNGAGFRTGHLGVGRCYLHGGSTPIRHGKYSDIKRAGLGERVKELEKDPGLLSLTREVALLQALTEDLLERWDLIYGPDGALLAWHNSYLKGDPDKAKPRQLPDFSSISTLVDRVGAMVDRIKRHEQLKSVSLATLNRVMEQMGVEVAAAAQEIKLEPDKAAQLCEAVERRWSSLRLDPYTSSDSRSSSRA